MERFGFDTTSGALLIGQTAIALRQEQVGPSVAPLLELLTTPDFPFRAGDFPPLAAHEAWQVPDYLAFGQWALAVVRQEDEQAVLTPRHISRLHILGLGPHRETLHVLRAFRWLSNQPLHGDTASFTPPPPDFTEAGIIGIAERVAAGIKRKPAPEDYARAARRGEMPGKTIIDGVFGSVGELNERMGYPRPKHWSKAKLLDFGIRFVRTNGELLFAPTVMEIVRKRKRGPSTQLIAREFGSWRAFKTTVIEIVQQAAANEMPLPDADPHLLVEEKDVVRARAKRMMYWRRYRSSSR